MVPIDICNNALAAIGSASRVASIDPPERSAEGRFCAQFYPVARDELLEGHAWRFNTRRVALDSVPVPDGVMGEWTFAYALPSNCLRPLAVYSPGATEVGQSDDYAVETLDDDTQVVYTDTPGAWLKFLVRVTDTSRYPPSFCAVLSALLATYLAHPITRSKDAKDKAIESYALAYAQATALDSRTQQSEDWREERQPFWLSGR